MITSTDIVLILSRRKILIDILFHKEMSWYLFIQYESFRILDKNYGAPETPAAQRGSSSHSSAQNRARRWWRWQRRQDHPPLLHLHSRHGGRPPAPLILDCSQNIQLPVLDIWWVNVSLLSKWIKCTYNKHVAIFRVHIYHTEKNVPND